MPSLTDANPRYASTRSTVTPEAFSTRLREATRESHTAVEDAFALDERLVGRDAYTELLATMRGFYGPVEAALAATPGWSRLKPILDLPSRCRAALLDEDLKRLGYAFPRHSVCAAAPPLPSLADGLGCLYVLEGSALGGRIVARRARAALGEDLPVTFFTSAGRDDLGADWRALQVALDAYGAGHDAAARRRTVVAAANATFACLRAWVQEARPRS